jgi:hypothetical protein
MQRKGDCDFFAWANNEMTVRDEDNVTPESPRR